jgi:hypothetical protein
MKTGRMEQPASQLPTRWIEYNVEIDEKVRQLRCKKTSYNSRSIICDLRSKSSVQNHGQHVVFPYRQKKYRYSYDGSLPNYSNDVTSNTNFYLKIV